MIESTIALTSSPEQSSKSLLSSQFIIRPSKTSKAGYNNETTDGRTLRGGERKNLTTSLLYLQQQELDNKQPTNGKDVKQRKEGSITKANKNVKKEDEVSFLSSDAAPSKVKYKAISISTTSNDSPEKKLHLTPKRNCKFAYVYLLGGCNPSNPAYRGFLYNIMISTYLQRQKGSAADVVILLQMLSTSDDEQLPQHETDLLNKMNIIVDYLPKNPKNEELVRFNFEKFRVLNMTQYERVLYFDSDIMVMENMDYMFELTTNGTLRENLIVAQRKLPAYGGFFIVKPNAEGYADVTKLIQQRERNEQNGVIWDIEKGWGHVIDTNDKYDLASGKKSNLWDYVEAQGDPGLLFHYTKYIAKSVSIIAKDVVQNWHPDGSSTNERVPVTHSKSTDYGTTDLFSLRPFCWDQTVYHKRCIQPFSDYVHFPSVAKPWLHNPPPDLSENTIYNSAGHYWFHSLQQLNKIYDIGINFDDEWNLAIRPLLGLFAKWTPIGAVPTRVKSTVDVPAKVVETKPEEAKLSEQESAQESEVQTTVPVVNLRVPYNYTYWQTKPSSRFAYAYVVGGCDPKNPSYRNYIYDIMISTYNQRIENSQADVIILFQMLYKSKYDSLPQEDITFLEAMNIKYMYLPKSSIESFYRIMLDKFRILNLTQYDRVFFMDSDVMALGNMDYVFDLSMKGVLKKNLIFAGVKEPANGGTFMLAPNEGSWNSVLEIIHDKEQRGLKMPYPHWDDYVGWGYLIDNTTDYYQFVGGKKGHLWNFYGAFADQGLLFHWVKYEEKSVSIIFKEDIQNWDVGPDGTVQLQETIGIDKIPDVYTSNRHCWHDVMNHKPCTTPHSDFIHFTGQRKPWLAGPPNNFGTANSTESPDHYWYYILSILNQDLNIGLDFSKWKTRMRPALGFYPKLVDAAGTEYKKTLK